MRSAGLVGKCYLLVNMKFDAPLGIKLGWVLNKASSFRT